MFPSYFNILWFYITSVIIKLTFSEHFLFLSLFLLRTHEIGTNINLTLQIEKLGHRHVSHWWGLYYKRGSCFTPWQSDCSLTLTHPIHCLLLYGKYVSNFQALVTGALETSHAAIRHLHTEGRALAINIEEAIQCFRSSSQP